MNIIDTSDLSREQWLDLRVDSIGASDSAVIAGLSKYKSRFGLWLEKTRQGQPDEAGEEAWWGSHLESPILGRLATTGDIDPSPLAQHQAQVMVRHSDLPWMTATLDLVTECGHVWELKAAGIQTAKRLENGNARSLPDAWILQAHHQMLVAGVQEIHFAVFVGHRLQLYTFVVEYDAQVAEGLMQLEHEFRKHVEDGTPPAEFDASDVELLLHHYRTVDDDIIVTEDDRLMAMARQYELAASNARMQSEIADQLKAGLLARMTTACGLRVGPYLMRRKKIDVRAQEPKPRAAYSYVKFTFSNTESEE